MSTTSVDTLLDKLPPQALEAEICLLGSMLKVNDVISDIVQMLAADDFYRREHQIMYDVITRCYDDGRPVDYVILKTELDKRGVLEDVGGDDYIIDVINSVPSALNARFYAETIKEKAVARHLITAASDILKKAYSPGEDTAELLDWTEKTIFQIAEKGVSTKAGHIKEIIHKLVDLIDSRDSSAGVITGVPSGYSQLDHLTAGFQPGEFIVIAARPSVGKSTIGLNIMEHVAVREKIPSVMFTCEMSEQMVAQALICSYGHISGRDLRSGYLGAVGWDRFTKACGELSESSLYIDDTPSIHLMEMRAKARRLHAREKVGLVMVDYLQLMRGPKAESRQQEIAEISRGLKGLARELEVPVVAMCQLNREVEGRPDHRPRMSDLRESGAIEQDADVIMLLHREDYYEENDENRGKAELILAKQRNGPTGKVELFFDKEHRAFRPLETHVG